ncbi:MAG: hypothetical protein ACK43K_05135 [Chitinophagales bacterium]|nr:hypothetical protein [Sphingobacteriales bacterium]
MAFEITLRKEAVADIELALNYYLQISPRIVFNFDEELDECFQILLKHLSLKKKFLIIEYFRCLNFPILSSIV